MNTLNTSPFIVPLLHDYNNNQTTLWDGINKPLFIGNDAKYQNITKILNASKDTMNKSIFLIIYFIGKTLSIYVLLSR